MQEIILPNKSVSGRVRAHEVRGDVWDLLTAWDHNQVLYGWGTVVGTLLTKGLSNYRIGGMYLEYENVADPDDPVSAPTFDRSGGKSYYDGLGLSATRDYLRVPLTASLLSSSDETLFPDGNVMTFFAQSQGVTGANGKAFSDTVNSKIYGGALVAFLDEADADQDIVFSRFYFSVANQQVKLPTSQIGLEWEITLQ